MQTNMLSFPTPRPPAQIRRASRQKSSPPPPYAQDLPEDEHEHDCSDSVFAADKLKTLLDRADERIRQRERNLSVTSDLSRDLNTSSQVLRRTHQALLDRLPTSPASPSAPLRQATPHLYSNSSPRVSTELMDSTRSQPFTPTRHSRRVSISPNELARLADQNAELVSKLEQLQEESEQADKLGKRRLGKLEDEIQLLRRELDEARIRSEVLEEHNIVLQRESAETQLRKQERNERMDDARRRGAEMSTPLLDFAPSSSMTWISGVHRRTASSGTVVPLREISEDEQSGLHAPSSESSRAVSPMLSPVDSTDPPESALVSRLLSKIRELEEANDQIDKHQQNTTLKLRAAQVEADTIRRLYDFLDESAEIDIEEGDGFPPALDSFVFPARGDRPNTIRFRSLQRTIDGELDQASFEAGIEGEMHSTLRSGHKAQAPTRPSLTGLFDSPSKSSTATDSSTVFEEPGPSMPDDGRPSSPLSALSMGEEASLAAGQRRKTLGSELGSNFGDDVFTGGVGNRHFHTSSIFASETPSAASSMPPSPSQHPIVLPQVASPSPALTSRPTARPSEEPQTPTIGGNTRMRRLSQTVRARTHRWVDRRLNDTFQSMRLPPAPDALAKSQATPVLGTKESSTMSISLPLPDTTAIDRVFDTVDTALDRIVHAIAPGNTTLTDSQSTSTVVPARSLPEGPLSRRQKLAMLMIELWLWLQFAIIVLAFVYAMAKRGPKSVLKGVDRKHRTTP